MKLFIALLSIALAVATHGSYVPSAWSSDSLGWNSWNGWNDWNGLNSWNDHSSVAWPAYGNSWSSAAWPAASWPSKSWQSTSWPSASLYNKGWNGWYAPKATVVQAKINPWGLPWASYGHGYNNYLVGVPTAKYIAANPGATHVAPLVGHAINQKLIVA
ncbi:bifunctional endo-1,4-beta-xylanase XylA-like [Topomyia yanbarensis]|uniref:bifunctional endo-1,4-beta-xylanase XylA-like n=1 Tax=Topomyia yanbarensis TaxID=2498891 RepID=UPI00273B6491|nr:bifunctional endo-1,4-beta-xylanase XylA-like [Topomyia yanbarensis]